ncbi:hypothetical protein BKA64DRAFT_702399 [Cadophora sp. MPI-SDFR-AT-0126]|nr:hypothetical protein BKA64DRAFT_702399 [Leotiomycetes sp. MPI-SDFR-AT-0126]
MAFNNGKEARLTILMILTMSATINSFPPSDLSKLPDFFDILTNLRLFQSPQKLFHQKHSPPSNFTHHPLHTTSFHHHPPQISPILAKMVTQTRRMARSALRSDFLESQSLRHQTRSVVRATTLFKSLPEGTPPPPAPQTRTRKRRAPAPEPEDEAGRPAKLRWRAAPAPSPSPPSPTPPPPYIPTPIPSPTTIFPPRQGHSFKPLATPAEAARASFFLDLFRDDFHGTPQGAARIHHYPGAPVPPKKIAHSWALERPRFRDAEEEVEEMKDEIRWTRFGEYKRGVSRSPRQWLNVRMGKTEDATRSIQKVRRLETAIDKERYMAPGRNLLTWKKYRYVPWTPSDLPDELGWTTVGESLYFETKKAKRPYI